MISVIRLTTGAEIVGTITSKDIDAITVNNPLQIMYVQRTSGAPAISMQRYVPFSSQEEMVFKTQHVELICKPVKGLNEYYDKALQVIRTHTDPSIVTDLENHLDSKSSSKNYDAYLAMLEHHMSKKPLN